MRKGIVALLIATGLGACTSVSEAYFATDIQVITEDRLPNFRPAKNETVSFRATPGFRTVSFCGYVVVECLIDSNGSVCNPEISDWGTLMINFADCEHATATFDGIEGQQTMSMVKLAGLQGSGLNCH